MGVDQALVIGAEEEIFEMNSGYICCTVREDLRYILGRLMKRRDRLDHILTLWNCSGKGPENSTPRMLRHQTDPLSHIAWRPCAREIASGCRGR